MRQYYFVMVHTYDYALSNLLYLYSLQHKKTKQQFDEQKTT